MKLGQVVITKAVGNTAVENHLFYQFVFDSLERYKNRDWGDLPN